jgi:hypothetical protein
MELIQKHWGVRDARFFLLVFLIRVYFQCLLCEPPGYSIGGLERVPLCNALSIVCQQAGGRRAASYSFCAQQQRRCAICSSLLLCTKIVFYLLYIAYRAAFTMIFMFWIFLFPFRTWMDSIGRGLWWKEKKSLILIVSLLSLTLSVLETISAGVYRASL